MADTAFRGFHRRCSSLWFNQGDEQMLRHWENIPKPADTAQQGDANPNQADEQAGDNAQRKQSNSQRCGDWPRSRNRQVYAPFSLAVTFLFLVKLIFRAHVFKASRPQDLALMM
jgi:hypothetical protein